MHTAVGDHCDLRRRCRQPVRIGGRIVSLRGVGVLHQPGLHLPEPHPRPVVESPLRHNTIRDDGGDCDRRLLHRRTGRTTAVVDLGGALQLTDPRGARNRDLGVGVHREGREAVHIRWRESRIVERIQHRLGAANRNSLRPEFFEKSLAPMPTMAALPESISYRPLQA